MAEGGLAVVLTVVSQVLGSSCSDEQGCVREGQGGHFKPRHGAAGRRPLWVYTVDSTSGLTAVVELCKPKLLTFSAQSRKDSQHMVRPHLQIS